jgi:hypothetical protein
MHVRQVDIGEVDEAERRLLRHRNEAGDRYVVEMTVVDGIGGEGEGELGARCSLSTDDAGLIFEPAGGILDEREGLGLAAP